MLLLCLDLGESETLSNLMFELGRELVTSDVTFVSFDSKLNCNSMKLLQTHTQGRDNIYIAFYGLFEQLQL